MPRCGQAPLDQAVAALVVAEQHEVFAEQLDRLDRPVGAGQFVDQRGRLPVAPHQRAGRGARADAGDEIVLFLGEHGNTSGAFIELYRAAALRHGRA